MSELLESPPVSEAKVSQFQEPYDFRADLREVLMALNYNPAFVQNVLHSYSHIVDACTTAFNYYRFGRFFQILRNGLSVRVSTGLMTERSALLLSKKVSALESYILPKMCISGDLDF